MTRTNNQAPLKRIPMPLGIDGWPMYDKLIRQVWRWQARRLDSLGRGTVCFLWCSLIALDLLAALSLPRLSPT